MKSIIETIKNSSEKYGNRSALIIRRKVKKEAYKFSDLATFVEKSHAFFEEYNIKEESKILIWGMNCPEYAMLLLSIFSLNRCAVPIDYRTSEETILKITEKIVPTIAFVSKYLKSDFLKKQNVKIEYIEDIFTKMDEIVPTNSLAEIATNTRYTNPENTLEIVYTSGTTGIPKGVVIKQKNISSNLSALQKRLSDMRSELTISILPLSHMFEQIIGLLLPINMGITIVYLPRINSFKMLQAFKEYKPTHLIFVPQMLKIIWDKIVLKANEAGKYQTLVNLLKLSNILPKFFKKILFYEIHQIFGGDLKYIASGGAPLDKRIAQNFSSVGLNIIEGYGATEVTAVATMNDITKPIIGSVGKPLDNVKIKIVNEEIVIESQSISDGYYLDPSKTAEVFRNTSYKTGDIGMVDENGYVYIKGRESFKIVLPSGEKVYAEDIEMKIKENSFVEDVCVVAKIMDNGDKIHAIVITNNDVDRVIKEVNTRLESKQQITSYEKWIESDFPRTSTLKINRKFLSDYVNDQKILETKNNAATTNLYDIVDILSLISGFTRERITDDDILASDLEIDSLGRTELVSLIEEYLGLSIEEGQINSKTTVRELKEMLQNAGVYAKIKLPTWQFNAFGYIIHKIFLLYVLNPLHSFFIKIKYTNTHDIEPGSIVLFNHPGILDGTCILRTLQKTDNLKMVTNSWVGFWEKGGIMPKILEILMGGVPLYETGNGLIEVLKLDSDLLDKGYNLLFAPQGRIQPNDIEDPFKPGIGYIVKMLNRSVYIIKIKGYRDIWPLPKGKKDLGDCGLFDLLPKRRGTVELTISKKIKLNTDNMSPIQISNYLEELYKEL